MDRELEYIKLKVDWYKSIFPWILAMVVGAVSFAHSIDPKNQSRPLVLTFLFFSVVFLLGSLLASWYAAVALIHRLEEPYKYKSAFLNLMMWMPHGTKWEVVFSALNSFCLGAGLGLFVGALASYVLI